MDPFFREQLYWSAVVVAVFLALAAWIMAAF
jgi:hypothetical protein